MEFYETVAGQRFFEGQLPRLIAAIEEHTKATVLLTDTIARVALADARITYTGNTPTDLHLGDIAAGLAAIASRMGK